MKSLFLIAAGGLVDLVERRVTGSGEEAEGSNGVGAGTSLRPGALCDMRLRRARGVRLADAGVEDGCGD